MAIEITEFRADTWERIERAAIQVEERARRSAAAPDAAGIDYAIAGDNAVAAWVRRVDEGAERTAVDVERFIRRSDRDAACATILNAGLLRRAAPDRDLFVDDPRLSDRSAVRVISASDVVGPDAAFAFPDPSDSVALDGLRVLTVEATARRELAIFKTLNRVRLDDLLNVGVIDATWLARLPPTLAERLQYLIDHPE